MVKPQIENGVDVNLVDTKDDQPTALLLAFKGGWEEIARYLISKNRLNVNGKDAHGNTCPLYLARCKDSGAMADTADRKRGRCQYHKCLRKQGTEVLPLRGGPNLEGCRGNVSKDRSQTRSSGRRIRGQAP